MTYEKWMLYYPIIKFLCQMLLFSYSGKPKGKIISVTAHVAEAPTSPVPKPEEPKTTDPLHVFPNSTSELVDLISEQDSSLVVSESGNHAWYSNLITVQVYISIWFCRISVCTTYY